MNQNLKEDAMMEEAIASAELSMDTLDTELEKFLPTERELEKVGEHYWGGDYTPSLIELSNLRYSLKEVLAPRLKEILSSRDASWEERVRGMLYEVDVEMTPTIADEAWANQFDNKAEAFWYGQAQYRKDILLELDNLK